MSTTQTVRMFAPTGIGGLIQAPNGTYVVGSDGVVTVNAADAQFLIGLGFQYAVTQKFTYTTPGAPVAQSATVTTASGALSNGTLAITQPDCNRQIQAIVFPGTTSITAGTLTYVYTANDGTTQTDVLNLAMASQAAGVAGATLATTKGVERMTSMTVAGLSGGTSPTIEVGTNNFLGVPVPQRFADFAVLSEKKITPTAGTLGLTVPSDETVPTTLITTGALISPTSAPNGTLWLSFGYNATYPA